MNADPPSPKEPGALNLILKKVRNRLTVNEPAENDAGNRSDSVCADAAKSDAEPDEQVSFILDNSCYYYSYYYYYCYYY